MADVVVVPASVKFRVPSDKNERNYPYQAGVAFEAIEAGKAVYRRDDTKIALAKASGSSLEANCIGISANHARVDQEVSVCGPEGDVDLGVDIGEGTPYYLSTNAGMICPHADVVAGMYVVKLGDGTELRNFKMDIVNLEILIS